MAPPPPPPPTASVAFAVWHAARTAGRDGRSELSQLQVAVATALRPLVQRTAPRGCDGEDLLQEAWARFLPRALAGEFAPGDGVPLAWFRRVLKNLIVDHVRRVDRQAVVTSDLQESPDRAGEDAGADLEREERRAQVRAALEALRTASPGRAYDVVALLHAHHVEGKTAEEIALALGKDVNAVEQALVRARRAFKRHYKGDVGSDA